MKKRFYFMLLVLAVILLALPGLTAKGVIRVLHHPRRFARQLAGSIPPVPVGGWAHHPNDP